MLLQLFLEMLIRLYGLFITVNLSFTKDKQVRLDVVLAEDEGEYRCTVKREQHFVHRTIRLKVRRPAVTLSVIEVRF